jgi:hypothetical protein
MSFHSRAFLSDGFRLWLRGIQNTLKVNQVRIAKASEVSRPWLCQIMTGRRKLVDPSNMGKLKAGLLRLLQDYSGADKPDILRQLELEFDEIMGLNQSPLAQSPEAMRGAAELLEILVARYSSNKQRRQVVTYLQLIVDQSIKEDD